MAKQKAAFDGGIYLYKIVGSQVWHVIKELDCDCTICGVSLIGTIVEGTLAVPNGERICSKCLHKLEKALGEAHRIVNVGD